MRHLAAPRRAAGNVRDWRLGLGQRLPSPEAGWCATCGAAHTLEDLPAVYVYLLGQYLGDGHLALLHRGVWMLRVFMDRRHVRLAGTVRDAMTAVVPSSAAAIGIPAPV